MLAVRPDVQDKLAEEVDRAYDDNGGKTPPSYTAIQGSLDLLSYVDWLLHFNSQIATTESYVYSGNQM